MRICEFTGPVVNIKAQATKEKKQADAYPQTGHRRSGHRACSFAFGCFLIRFLLFQISSSFPSPIIIQSHGRKTPCPARDITYIGRFRGFSTQLHIQKMSIITKVKRALHENEENLENNFIFLLTYMLQM